jgi:hypothetical protein
MRAPQIHDGPVGAHPKISGHCSNAGGLGREDQKYYTSRRSVRVSESVQLGWPPGEYVDGMSERNGDRARFQKNRKRKLRHRQRIRALIVGLLNRGKERLPSRVTEQVGLVPAGQLTARN